MSDNTQYTDRSVYNAPQSDPLNTENQGFAHIEIFSASQRIGRLRYLAYSVMSTIVVWVALIVLSAIFGAVVGLSGNSGMEIGASLSFTMLIGFLVYLIPFIISFILARRRLHDLDQTGWLGLLMIIPIVNLIFFLYLLLAPGSPSTNRYGLKPTPNTAATWVAGLVAPVLFIGLIAAVAIPAYQRYVEDTSQYSSSGF